MVARTPQDSILIIANGELPQKSMFNELSDWANCIIAVDGGCNICFDYNIHPHFVIGDLDSISSNVRAHLHDTEIIHIHDQHRHDMDKAFDFAASLNPTEIKVIGAFGKRFDHSIANLLLLQTAQYKYTIDFIDDYGQLSLVREDIELKLSVNRTISLFSFLPVKGLTLEGVKYPLLNQNFPNGFNGLSNLTNRDTVKVRLREGSLFLYIIHEHVAT